MRTVAVWSIKGGVGKTSAAVNLACLAAGRGLRTLLWDLDAQGAASYILRVKPGKTLDAQALARRARPIERFVRATDTDNLDMVPAGTSLRHLDLELAARKNPAGRLALKLAPLNEDYDVALMDCPPSLSVIAEAVLHAAMIVLVPVVPTPLALRSLDQIRRLLPQEGATPRLLPFLSMVDRRKSLHRELAARHAGVGGFLRTVIPLASAVEQMAVRRQPLPAFAPSLPVTVAFAALWEELARHLEAQTETAPPVALR